MYMYMLVSLSLSMRVSGVRVDWHVDTNGYVHMYMCLNIHLQTNKYVYIYRERWSEREVAFTSVWTFPLC